MSRETGDRFKVLLYLFNDGGTNYANRLANSGCSSELVSRMVEDGLVQMSAGGHKVILTPAGRAAYNKSK